ncbi:teichoic acid glycosyl transferase [Leuconostoc pseudomesenteroides]|uniref:teichoic acid glycosyl transferase n=1 Tax=Leuconostoc pseudomesenteroides TaxID=33968 RepID=UPI00403D5D63
MFTIGRSLINGIVPYKDVIDQRGPFLYALFALGAAIKSTSFFGVFVIQTVNVFIVYWLSIKIATDLDLNKKDTVWVGLLGPLSLLSTSAYSFSGSPEEFAFTSVLYLLYVINHYHQEITQISMKHFFLLGVCLSLVFWNKYSMIGAFVVFFFWTAIAALKKKEFLLLVKIVVFSLLGFLSISVVILTYFVLHGALKELVHIYFVQNLTAYGKSDQSTLMKLWALLFLMAREINQHYIAVILIIISWLTRVSKNNKQNLEMMMFGISLIFVALQHRIFDYYNLIWMPFLAVALTRLSAVLIKGRRDYLTRRFPSKTSFYLLVSALIILLPIVNNTDLAKLILIQEKQSVANNNLSAQTKFGKLIQQKRTGLQQPSLIMINSLDQGFFLSSRTLPSTTFFHRLNMTYDQLPQMYNSFNQDLSNKKTDFVIVKLNFSLDKNVKNISKQVNSVVDPHLRESLDKNYRIESTAQNSTNESYALLYKK